MSKPAALYIRVSTEEQLEFSPEAQKKALLKYALDNGYNIQESNIFIDEGVSGRKAEKRPEFMKMIAKAKEKDKPFEFILIHKFDRFARSREDSVVYKSLLKKECGVKVISITESIEDDKFSVILEAMLEAMAEYYSINLSEEVKKGMTEKALRGGLQTSPPFGYAVTDNKLVPIEDEANLAKEMFRRFIHGEGYLSIAKWLNAIGAKTHRGNKFENRSVEYIIRNPVYIGKLRWNPKGRTRRDYDNENIILADAGHIPLIDSKTWEAAQNRAREIKSSRKYRGRAVIGDKDWLSGIVRCADCRCCLAFSKPHYWKCNGYAKGTCKSSQHIRDDIIKEAIIAQLDEDIKSEGKIHYKKLYIISNGVDESSILIQQTAKLTKKLERLRDAYLEGAETLEVYKQTKQTLENEIDEINRMIEQAISTDEKGHEEIDIDFGINSILDILNSDSISKVKKNNAIKSIIDAAIFSKAENLLEIEYKSIPKND